MKKLSFLMLVPVLLSASCEKDKNEEPKLDAGKGGTATLKLTTQHHSAYIDSCMVYIAYNTLDAVEEFDDSMKVSLIDGKPQAIFTNLKNGDYYVYGEGYDPGIFEGVKGGIPVKVRDQDSTYDYILPVTEDSGH